MRDSLTDVKNACGSSLFFCRNMLLFAVSHASCFVVTNLTVCPEMLLCMVGHAGGVPCGSLLFVLLLSPGLTTLAAAAETPLYLCTQLRATHAGDAFTVMRSFGLAWAAPRGSPIDSGCLSA